MAADLQEQAVQVEWKAAKITAAALKGLIEKILANREKITHGEQSLKKLNLQGKKLESIELTGEDMQAFKRELNKYAVDFSIKKDTETQNYTVFFKGQDVDRVYKGLQKCVENFQKGSKKPIKEVMKEAEEKAAQRNAERTPPEHEHIGVERTRIKAFFLITHKKKAEVKIMELLNQVLTLVTKFAIIGGGLWLVWGVVVLAGGLKDKNGPALQSGIWQIVGGGLIIVNRQRSIENFVPQTYFTLTANCGSFKAYSRADDQAKAQQIVEKCSGKDAYVSKAEKEEKREKPAALYDLTTLQRDANRLLGYSAQQTLDYLQKLYDNKLATYPRTDSRYITADQEQSTRSLIDTILATGIISTEVASNYSTENVTMAQIINDKKVSDHHAVLPTSGVTKEKLDNLPTGERNILLLVSYRLLSAVYAPHTYTATKVVLDIEGEPFTATGREEIDLGFKQIDDQVKKAVKAQEEKEDAPDTPENAVLPPMSEGNTFTASEVKAEPKKTKPQPSYTEDTLLKAMETAGKSIVDEELKDAMKDSGLGTPATRAGIIENIVKAGYIVRNGKKLLPTETAYTFIDLVTDKIKEPELTAEWEKQLAAIQRGEKKPTDFMQEISGFIRSFVMDTKALYSPEQSTGVFQSERESIGICPKCGKKVVEYPKSFSCESGKGGCGFVIWKTTASKAISKAQAVKLLAKGKTDLIKGFTSKAGKPFDANLVLKEDKTVGFDFPPRK